MDERMQFVARRLADEAMAELCREFGISCKTGYKIFERYQECSIRGNPGLFGAETCNASCNAIS